MIEIPKKLVEEISTRRQRGVFLIAIDGCGGAGKSTCAAVLAGKLDDSQIVHVDDFYKPKGKRIEITEQTSVHSNFEFERLKQQVLEPLRQIIIANHQTPGGDTIEIQPSSFVIVEGLGTLGTDLRDYFDYRIWVDSPEASRRQRGIGRDTEDWTKIWDQEYLPQDARYVREQAPQNAADWIIKNE